MAEPLGRKLDRTSPWLLWGVLALGLAFTGMGIVAGVEQAVFAASETRTTEGSVVGHVPVRRRTFEIQREPVAVRLVVRYSADGQAHEFKSQVSYSPWERPIGHQVPVVYRPGRPGSGQIDTFTERWGHVPVFCGLGPLLAALGATALAVRSRRRRGRSYSMNG